MPPTAPASRVAGLVLAAGAGSRFGGPKGLARTADGEPWVARAVSALREGGCGDVLVAVGAAADEVAALVPPGVTVVRVDDWAEGMSASLRAGLLAGAATGADAVLVVTVDTPDLPASAVTRVRERGGSRAVPPVAALVQATYDGRPGHPVLIGRDRIPAVVASLHGDRGARAFIRAHGGMEVDCGDLWSGADVDRR
jgi:CTP:molybdopterin cytidylyltransferase MocA